MIIAHISDMHVQPAGELLFDKIDTNARWTRPWTT